MRGYVLKTVIMSETKNKDRWYAIEKLLDDETPSVRSAVLRELKSDSESGRVFLQEISKGSDNILARHASTLIKELGWVDGVGDFLRFIRSRRYELETGWFLLDRTIYPDFNLAEATLFMDQVAERVRELLTPPVSSRQSCAVINRVLFHEYGFRGAGRNFEDPENSFLHRVIQKREGLPITLCVLYLLIARRISIEMEPIGFPGRFMIASFESDEPFYLDPWAGGKILEIKQVESLIGSYDAENYGSVLLPITIADTLVRGCRNLVNHYNKAEEHDKAELFVSFVREFERVHSLATDA